MGVNRVVAASVLLAVCVVVVAGLTGTTHSGGVRFLPHFKGGAPQAVTRTEPGSLTQRPATRPHQTGVSPALGTVLLLLLIVVICTVVGYLLWRWWRNRRAPRGRSLAPAPVEVTRPLSAAPPQPEVLLTGIEVALQTLDAERDPGDAIVRAWLGLEETAGESGIRRDPSETPTEFTSRVMRAAFADDAAIGTLLRLYLRTRFGDHPVNEADVAEVRAALAQLVDGWRATHPVGVGAS